MAGGRCLSYPGGGTMHARLSAALLALLITCAASVASAQTSPRDTKIDGATRAQVIKGVIAALKAKYVFPEVATKIEVELGKHVKARRYDNTTSAIAFAEMLTRDIRAISHDKHMHVFYSDTPIPDDPKPDANPAPEELEEFRTMMKRFNAGFVKTERLDGNIGYVRLDAFMPGDEAVAKAAAAMTFIADTDALVI